MGIQANYMAVDDAALERLIAAARDSVDGGEDLFELVEEMEEAGADLYGMAKAWDILHFILTGKSASSPIEDDPLSEAIVGVDVLAADDVFIAVTPRDRLPVIVDALLQIDFSSLRPSFSLAALRENDIYPRLAESDNNTDTVWEQMCCEFLAQRGFLKETADTGRNIIVSIY